MTPKESFIPFLKLILKDRKQLLKSLLHYTREADKRTYFKKKYGTAGIPFVQIDKLAQIEGTVNNYTYLDGTSRVVDIAFIMGICRNYKDCNYLEIGSWRGESLVNVAEVAKKCTSLSLSKEEMLSLGMSERMTDVQRLFSKGKDNIVHIEANSMNFDFNGLNEKFDVIFIDGDHTYGGVRSDTENAFKLLKDEHSVIIWHDCGGGYEGYRYEVLSAIMDGAPADKRDRIFRVSNTICGIYTNAKVDAEFMVSPQIPKNVFSVKMDMHPFGGIS